MPELIVLLLLALLASFARLAWRWRIGRAAPLTGVLAVPRRYLVNVHAVVARQPAASRMHSLTAGGLVAGSAVALTGQFPAVASCCFGIGLAGTWLAAQRRTGGRYRYLPIWLTAYLLGGTIAVFDSDWHWPALILAALGGAALVAETSRGPMRHALAGLTSLAAPARPQRFVGLSTDLASLDLTAAQLGVGEISDFTWNRLASFDACVQCGRCELACPAHAAGQPLNPKHFIQSLVNADRSLPIIGSAVAADTLWACTTCRACVHECPMLIEHVDAMIDLRRHQNLQLGAIPAGAVRPLAELRYAGSAGGHDLAARTDFAAGIELPILETGGQTDLLLWLGEGAYDRRHASSLRALLQLLHLAGARFACLGEAERDCGDLARRLGDEATFQSLAKENIATLTNRRFARIVTADPHALHVLRREYPALGGTWTVLHHSELLDEFVQRGMLRPNKVHNRRIAYHDPCYLARYNGQVAAPRRLLDTIATQRLEMPRHGLTAMCCGGGGGAPDSDVAGKRRIADLRMDQARDAGAELVAVACPGCTAMLEGVTGPRPQVKDVAELLWEACHE